MNKLRKQNKLHIDFESRSEVDLKLVGAYKYAQHPTTEILCMSYALNDEPVKCVEYGKQMPDELMDNFNDVILGNTIMTAFNAFFERNMFKFKLKSTLGDLWFPELAKPP